MCICRITCLAVTSQVTANCMKEVTIHVDQKTRETILLNESANKKQGARNARAKLDPNKATTTMEQQRLLVACRDLQLPNTMVQRRDEEKVLGKETDGEGKTRYKPNAAEVNLIVQLV